jgi:hypothetical protein
MLGSPKFTGTSQAMRGRRPAGSASVLGDAVTPHRDQVHDAAAVGVDDSLSSFGGAHERRRGAAARADPHAALEPSLASFTRHACLIVEPLKTCLYWAALVTVKMAPCSSAPIEWRSLARRLPAVQSTAA